MARSEVKVTTRDDAIADLLASRELPDLLLEASRPIVMGAKARAPRATGAGAESIRAEAVLVRREWQAHISWSELRFYMLFHEVGTRYVPPRSFLVAAAKEATR
jgi:hypothetical protein